MDIVLTSGQFVLHGVLERIQQFGTSVRTFHYSVDGAENDQDELEKELQINSYYCDSNNALTYKLLEYFGIGGKSVCTDEYLEKISGAHFYRGCADINIMDKYINVIAKRFNVKLILLHVDMSPRFHSICLVARKLGIPTVCIYNGCLSSLQQKYSSVMTYDKSSMYILKGDYEREFIEKRGYQTNSVVLGMPSWDLYYEESQHKREENTFLFSPSSEHTKIFGKQILVVTLVACLWHKDVVSKRLDNSFYAAFAKYQQYNTNAKLIVSLRQFSSHSTDAVKQLLDNFSIKNYEVVPYDVTPFRNLLKRVEYQISEFSTTAIEGIVSRTPTMITAGTLFPFDYWESNGSLSVAAGTVDTIYDGLKRLPDEKESLLENCNKMAAYYNYLDDGNATQRVSNFIIDTYLR